jgi:hypothetical protein
VRADRDVKRNPADRTPLELADLFCRLSRRKVEHLFSGIQSNDDPEAYRVARGVLDGKYSWLEGGLVPPQEAAAPAVDSGHEAAAGR